jgi:SAM-dependent methyltransferase
MSTNQTISGSVSKYDNSYFTYQQPMGSFGGGLELFKFKDYIKPSDNLIDFGCGGGYLLSSINCVSKIGIEPNPNARQKAKELGITTVQNAQDIPDEWADVIISNHALEHTLHPLTELQVLYKKLKRGGKIVFVVPTEGPLYSYNTEDQNQHLFSWSPMCLGNLFKEAGFTVIESRSIIYGWPPYFNYLARLGDITFNLLSRIYGLINIARLSQSRVTAFKPI